MTCTLPKWKTFLFLYWYSILIDELDPFRCGISIAEGLITPSLTWTQTWTNDNGFILFGSKMNSGAPKVVIGIEPFPSSLFLTKWDFWNWTFFIGPISSQNCPFLTFCVFFHPPLPNMYHPAGPLLFLFFFLLVSILLVFLYRDKDVIRT